MEKSGGWRWTLSTFHCELISLLEWNTKIPMFPGRKDSMELWGLSFFPLSGIEGDRKVLLINIVFSPHVFYISVRGIFNKNFCFVSNLLCGQHTWDTLLALSLCEIHVGNLRVLSYGRSQEAERGAFHRSSDQWGNAFVQLQHSPNFWQPSLAVLQGRLQRWVLQRLFQNSSFPVGCSSAQGRAGRGSCPELCAWLGAAMRTIIYLPGAVLQTSGFMASSQVWVDTSKGTCQPTLFLDLKIFLLIGKLACSSQSQQCYGHVSMCPWFLSCFLLSSKILCLSKICPNLSWGFFYLSLED